jgi:hypothetical protein
MMLQQVEPTQIKVMKSRKPFDKLAFQTRQRRQFQCPNIKEMNDDSWIDFGPSPKSTDATLSAVIQISKEDLQCYLPPHILPMNAHHMNMKRLEDDSARSSQTAATALSSPESSISSRKTVPKIVVATPSKKTGKVVLVTTTPTSQRNRNRNCNSLSSLSLPLNTSSHHSRSRTNTRVVQVQGSRQECTATAAAPRRRFKGEPVEDAKQRLSAGEVESTRSASRLRERSSECRRNSASVISSDKSLDRSTRSRRRDQLIPSPSTDHSGSIDQHLSRNMNLNMHEDEPTEDEKSCFASPKTTATPLEAWQLREQVKKLSLPHSIATTPRTTEDSSKSILEKALSKEERHKTRRAKKDADEEDSACTKSTGFEVKYNYKKPGHKAKSSASKSTCMVGAVPVKDCKQQEEQSKASKKQPKREPQESSQQSPLVVPKAPTLAAWQVREQLKKLPAPTPARKRLVSKKEESPNEEPVQQDTSPVKPQRTNTKEKEREERRKLRSSRTSVAQKELESKSQDELPSGFAVALKETSKADNPKNDQQETAREKRRKSRISTRVSVAKTELQSKPQDELLTGLAFALKGTSKIMKEDAPKDEDESNKPKKEERRKSRSIRTSGRTKALETNPHNEEDTGTPRSPPFASIPQSPGTRRSHPVAAWQLREQAKKKEQAKKNGSPGGLHRSSHHSAHCRVPLESPQAILPPAFRPILATPRSAIQQRSNKYLTTKAAMKQHKSESAVRRSCILGSMSNFLEPHETDPQKMISGGKVEIIDGKTRIVFELGGAAALPEGTHIPLVPNLFR